MKTKILLVVTLFLTLSVATTHAQLRHRPYNRTLTVRPGFRGVITPGEAARLHLLKKDLRRDAIRAKRNDGKIGPLERRHLKKEQRHLRRMRGFYRNNGRII